MPKFFYFFSAIVWAILITVFCLVQFKTVPLGNVSHLDKVVHAFFYFVLTFLVQLNWRVSKLNWSYRTQAVVSVVGTILFGVLIEILQETCTATRHADVLDVIANSVGALLSVVAFKLYVRFKSKSVA